MDMLRVICVAATLLISGQAWGFPVEVSEKIEGVQVAVEAMDLGENTAAVALLNYGEVAAQCRVRFRSGPGVPVTRNARVEAGQRMHVTAGFSHEVIRMRVDVNCRPAKGKKR